MTDEIPTTTPSDADAPPAPASAAAAEPPPGPLQALGGILFSPSDTFARMGTARWIYALTPLLVMALLGALTTFTFMKRVDQGEFMRDQLRQSRFASKMSDAMVEEQVKRAREANPWVRSAITLPSVVLVLALVALLFWVAFLAMGGGPTFTKSLAVVAWAQVPHWLNSLLATAMYFIKNPNDMDPTNPVLSNPAAFLEQGSVPGWLKSVLSNFDLFGIWVLVLYILGFSALGRVSKGKSAAIVIGLFILWVLLKAAFAAAFTM